MNGRRRLLLLVNRLEIGGAERQLVELARAIDGGRFHTTVMTLYPGGPLHAEATADGLRVDTLDRRGKYDFAVILRLAGYLRRERIDIIQPFLTPSTFIGMTAALIARTPVKIVTERCGTRVDPGIGSRVYQALEDRLSRFADAVVPNSRAGVEYLRARGVDDRQRVRLIYNGVNPQRVSAAPDEVARIRSEFGLSRATPVVGIIASLERAKDHETFLDAAARVAAVQPDVRFLVVGEGSLRSQLETQAHDLGISGRVHFAGNRSRVAPLLSLLTVAVLSSRDHEGCSNFILEAMGMGKPVVATTIGGNPELVTDQQNGYLVPPGDSDTMASRILALLKDPMAAASMGEAGRLRFEAEFSLPRMVAAYEDLYDELWSRKTASQGHRFQEAPR